jgi:hypothetical protein
MFAKSVDGLASVHRKQSTFYFNQTTRIGDNKTLETKKAALFRTAFFQ